jgi:transcriptional regulator with XRE-family HTH domain
MQELATLVRRYMEREGVSQEELAERIGVDQSTISRACARPAQRRSKARDKLMSFLSAAWRRARRTKVH